jgi:hypothetical protein
MHGIQRSTQDCCHQGHGRFGVGTHAAGNAAQDDVSRVTENGQAGNEARPSHGRFGVVCASQSQDVAGNAECATAFLHAHRNGCPKNNDERDVAQRGAKAAFEQVHHFVEWHIRGEGQPDRDCKQSAKYAEFEFGREKNNGHDTEGHQ